MGTRQDWPPPQRVHGPDFIFVMSHCQIKFTIYVIVHSPAPCSFLNHTAGFHRLRSHCSPTKRINNCQFHISYDTRPKTRNKQRKIIFGEQSCEKSERGEDLDPTTRGVGRRGRGGERLTAARVALEHAEVVVGVLHNLDDMDQIPSSCFPIILFLSLL